MTELVTIGLPSEPAVLLLPCYTTLGSTVRRDRDKDEIHADLIEAGWEELGSGCYCTAYMSPNGDRVLKLASGRGARSTIEAALANPDNPHLPKVYGIIDLPTNPYGRDEFAVEVEVLAHFWDAGGDAEDYLEWSYDWHPSRGELVDTEGNEDHPMQQAIDALRSVNSGGYWDCHDQNVMVRPSDGSLVLNDLIAG